MIAQGALDDPKVDAIAMLHVDSRLETGAIGITPGSGQRLDRRVLRYDSRAEADTARIRTPRSMPIPAAAAVVLALQNIAARETDPLASVVVTVGTIRGGYRNNVIADAVEMSGTLRAFDPAIREALEGRVRRIVDGRRGSLRRERRTADRARLSAGGQRCIAGGSFAEYVATTERDCGRAPMPTMGGEDFAYFAQRVPGLQIRLGVRSEAAGAIHPGHSPEFRIDEQALPIGVETLVAFARASASGGIRA